MLEMKNADISYSTILYHACPDFRLTAMHEGKLERLEAYRTRQRDSWIHVLAGNWPELVKEARRPNSLPSVTSIGNLSSTNRMLQSLSHGARHVLCDRTGCIKPRQILRVYVPSVPLWTTWKRFQVVGAGWFEHDLLEVGTGQNHDHKNQLAGFVHQSAAERFS
jgi:hypothetical protein